jgi:predicted anti-sigma-YlaC factor YlaD
MACNTFYRALRAADVLLPEPLSVWVRQRWLQPHAEVCPDCRTGMHRLARLNSLLREGLLGDATRYAVPRLYEARPPRRAVTGTARWAIACVSLWIAALALAAAHFSMLHRPAGGLDPATTARVRLQRQQMSPTIAVDPDPAVRSTDPAFNTATDPQWTFDDRTR